MLERKVIVTYEAINDIVDAEEYIRYSFGPEKAFEYRNSIFDELKSLSITAGSYANSGFKYKGYTIYKKPFHPAIIFWVIINEEVHILRVPREEYNWQKFFKENQYSEYSYPENSTVN